MTTSTYTPEDYPIVLYDSQCLMCDGFVRWLIRRDHEKILKFSGLQSDKALMEIDRRRIPIPEKGSVVLLKKNSFLTESDAVLEILELTEASPALISFIRLFPPKWRDALYGWVARNRYRFYKKRTYCPMPKPQEASRFV